MGFEYDLAKAFSDYLGVSLKVVTSHWESSKDVPGVFRSLDLL